MRVHLQEFGCAIQSVLHDRAIGALAIRIPKRSGKSETIHSGRPGELFHAQRFGEVIVDPLQGRAQRGAPCRRVATGARYLDCQQVGDPVRKPGRGTGPGSAKVEVLSTT